MIINKTLKPKQEIDDTYLKNCVSDIFMTLSGDDLVSRKHTIIYLKKRIMLYIF